MHEFLKASASIDWHCPSVMQLSRQLAAGTPTATAKQCFEWVRDNIKHSSDYQLNPVTCSASEVLQAGTGYCYAKSHLLAALLRANAIPAGLCYQRLSLDEAGTSFCLHGLNAVWLPEFGWYRIDPRGNKPNVDAQYEPPTERLAFAPHLRGEADIPGIFSDPLPAVINALRSWSTWDEVAKHLPDLAPANDNVY
jgi:transglutaminase-like putative cysteine protease